MLQGWKYIGNGRVVILARKDDFAVLPPDVKRLIQGVQGTPWGDKPGNPMTDPLVGATRAEIEDALKTHGWISRP